MHLLTDLIDQVLGQPAWVVLLVVGLVVFAEDALFVGFVLPGETAAVLGGVAAKLGHVPLWAVILTAVAASIIGDSVGYEVGRVFGPRILAHRWLDPRRAQIDRAQDLLARRGGTAVFMGRWVAFLRAVMPGLAGASRMPYRRFLVFNAAGGVLWGSVVVVAGYVAGSSYSRVESYVGKGGAGVVAVLVVAALVGWRLRRRHEEKVELETNGRVQATSPGLDP